jgi:hypothetical protein
MWSLAPKRSLWEKISGLVAYPDQQISHNASVYSTFEPFGLGQGVGYGILVQSPSGNGSVQGGLFQSSLM